MGLAGLLVIGLALLVGDFGYAALPADRQSAGCVSRCRGFFGPRKPAHCCSRRASTTAAETAAGRAGKPRRRAAYAPNEGWSTGQSQPNAGLSPWWRCSNRISGMRPPSICAINRRPPANDCRAVGSQCSAARRSRQTTRYAAPSDCWRVRRLERYGRVQVLEWYLNSASFGHLTFGADQRCQAVSWQERQRIWISSISAVVDAAIEAPASIRWTRRRSAHSQQLDV